MAKHRRSYVTIVVILLILIGMVRVSGHETVREESRIADEARPSHVIIISIDGMVPDYYTAPEKIGLKMPNLAMMKNAGAYAEGVEGVYPTVTYPSHTTLVTGVRPAVHGIVQNRIFE